MMATNNGRKLALSLAPAIGVSPTITATCSLICRHAQTHHRIAENDCNGYADSLGNWDELAAERADRKRAQIEARITALVATLPLCGAPNLRKARYPLGVKFQGDPRGATVKITLPSDWRHLGDDWAGESICVPI
jgi:hypothetical protein